MERSVILFWIFFFLFFVFVMWAVGVCNVNNVQLCVLFWVRFQSLGRERLRVSADGCPSTVGFVFLFFVDIDVPVFLFIAIFTFAFFSRSFFDFIQIPNPKTEITKMGLFINYLYIHNFF